MIDSPDPHEEAMELLKLIADVHDAIGRLEAKLPRAELLEMAKSLEGKSPELRGAVFAAKFLLNQLKKSVGATTRSWDEDSD